MADQIRELVIKVSIEADEKPLEDVGRASDETGTKAVALGTIIGNVVTKLGEMAVAAVKAGAAMLKDLVFGTAEAADRIAKLGNRLDVNTTQLQRMSGALELSGGSAEDLASGIRDLEKNLGEAIVKGTGPGAEALATFGLEVAEVDSLLQEGDLEGALGLIGDAANDLGDPLQKQAALLKLFGGAGAALEPLLEGGTEGVRELGDRISATGEIIDEEALASFEAMQDNLRDIEGRVQGAKNTIAVALAPAVSDIADRIEEWIDQNRSFIEQDLPAILEGLGRVLVDVAEFTIDLVTSWREFIRDASDLAEILAGDLDPALGGVGEHLTTMTGIAEGLALALSDVVVQLLEAVGASEELINVFREIRSALPGGDDDDGIIRVARGSGARLAEGEELEGGGTRVGTQKNVGGLGALSPLFADAIETRDTTKLGKIVNDPTFADEDRARAANMILDIRRADADKAAVDAAREATSRAEARARSRARAKEARERQAALLGGDGGGGGRGAGRRAAEPTIEDLIGQTVGGASPAALRSATSALSGTLFVTEDNSINVTIAPGAVDVGGIEVSTELPAQIGGATADAIDERVIATLSGQVRDVLEVARARRNVGP